MRKLAVLFLVFAGFLGYAEQCSWCNVNNHYHFSKEIYYIEYGGDKCIHINYNEDWNKNNYTIMFFAKGRETGTMYYEETDKPLEYVLDLVNIYISKNMSFYEIARSELGDEDDIEVSHLTGMKMSIAFGSSIFIFDRK